MLIEDFDEDGGEGKKSPVIGTKDKGGNTKPDLRKTRHPPGKPKREVEKGLLMGS